jgi:hypothetical protein
MIQSIRADIAPNENGHIFLVMDTVFDHKHTFTALGVGTMQGGQPHVSQVAQDTLAALAAYSEKGGRFHIVDIATEAAAPMRIRKALEAANDKDAVFFICRSDKVYDAAFMALNVRMGANGDASRQ